MIHRLITKIIFWLLLIVFFSNSTAKAADMPKDMAVGQTTVTQGDTITFGGNSGNFSVLNDINASMDYGFQNSILNNSACFDVPITRAGYCFILGTGLTGNGLAGSNRLLVSRTYIKVGEEEMAEFLETPALYLGGTNITGDAYGNDYLKDFSFWGKNLAQGEGQTGSVDNGATWQMENYSLNSDAQSSWLDETGQEAQVFEDYRAKISQLTGGAESIDSAVLMGRNIWNLQSSVPKFGTEADGGSEQNKFPDGKVWIVDAGGSEIVISQDVTYYGLGTLIVKNGIFKIGDNVEISPNNPSTDHLGIMIIN
ncbi:MAG: hypothetical protein WC107_02525 [Patescibacteria group bacterium]